MVNAYPLNAQALEAFKDILDIEIEFEKKAFLYST